MPILVTGATGFIGHRLVERLRSEGRPVRCTVRSLPKAQDLRDLGAETVLCDIAKGPGLGEAVQGVRSVIHLAGTVRAWGRRPYFDTNASGTRRLAEAAAAAGVERFLLVSSIAATGPGEPGRPVTEETPCRPVNPYGESKLLAEGELARHGGSMSWCVLRPCIVYGPWEKDFLVLFRMAAQRRRVPYVGPPEALISLIHVDDLDDLILAALERAPSGRIYQASDGQAYSWSAIIGTMGRVIGRQVRPLRIPPLILWPLAVLAEGLRPFLARPPLCCLHKLREGFERSWVSSPERARRDLGWFPRIGLEEGLRGTAAWYRAKGWL